MVHNFCLTSEFEHITKTRRDVYVIRTSKEDIYEPEYEGEGEDIHPTGRMIKTDIVSFTEEVICGVIDVPTIKQLRFDELEWRDTSPEMNNFVYNNRAIWFERNNIDGIISAIEEEKASGADTSILHAPFNEDITLPINFAIQMWNDVKGYASQCAAATDGHHTAIEPLDDIDDLLEYNLLTGYPERLVYNIVG